MNKISFLLLIFSLIAFSELKGQFLLAESNSYYSIFSMRDLKSTQNLILEFSPEGSRVVESFPVFVSHDINLMFKIAEVRLIGFWSGYQSTGGRISYADYSGSLNTDILISAYHFGLTYQEKMGNSPIWLSFKLAYRGNDASISSKLKTPNFEEKSEFKYDSKSIPLRPGLVLRKSFWKLYFNISIEYEFSQIGTPLEQVDDPDIKVLNEDGEEAIVDWSGFRLGIGLGIQL